MCMNYKLGDPETVSKSCKIYILVDIKEESAIIRTKAEDLENEDLLS